MSIGDADARTGLAWQRSGLAFVVCGVAMIKGVGRVGVAGHPVAGVVVIGLGVGIGLLSAWWAARRVAPPGEAPRGATTGQIASVAAVTVLVGLVSLAVALAE